VTGMAVREDDLAWNLVEQYRDLMTTEERTAVFVSLGVGDYPAVISSVLNAVATQKKKLSAGTAVDVRAWIDCYDNGVEFAILLSQIGSAATLDEPTARR